MDLKSKTYCVKVFDNSKDKDFIAALNIYSEYTPLSVKTNTSDITYWIDRYNNSFSDKFLVFGLYDENKIIGFSQLVYFCKNKLTTIDYMAIDKEHRTNGAFFTFIDLIKYTMINDMGLEVDFIVTEIEYDSSKKSPSETGIALIRLLKQSGFGVLKAEYFQPKLGYANTESASSAILMIQANVESQIITAKTYLEIVKTIYYDHYLRWYTPLLTTSELIEYKNEIDELYQKIGQHLGNSKNVIINGYKNLIGTHSNIELNQTGVHYGAISFILILLATTSIMGIAKYFGATVTEVMLCFLIATAIFFLFNSMFTGRGMKEFEKIKSILRLFGKDK